MRTSDDLSKKYGGDLNAAIKAIADGSVIVGGRWWVKDKIDHGDKKGILLLVKPMTYDDYIAEEKGGLPGETSTGPNS